MHELKLQFETIEKMQTFLSGHVPMPTVVVTDPVLDLSGTEDITGSPEVTETPVATVPHQMTTPTPDETPVATEPVLGEFDSKGRPWDARINSTKRTQTKVGIWKITRNTDKALVAAVYAEYDAKTAALAGDPNDPGVAGTGNVVPMEGYQQPDTTGQIPLNTGTVAPITQEIIVAKISELMVQGKIDAVTMMPLLQKHGVDNMMTLANRPAVLPLIMADLEAL